jgi:hypothetical protein
VAPASSPARGRMALGRVREAVHPEREERHDPEDQR